jgi:aryl-alcohol dehydrogenase-like predicted oxidoreductase
MKYRKLGHTGLIVSEVALGSMQFGGKMNMANLDQQDTKRMVKIMARQRHQFHHTADVTHSVGEQDLWARQRGSQEEIVLATKSGFPGENFNRSGGPA